MIPNLMLSSQLAERHCGLVGTMRLCDLCPCACAWLGLLAWLQLDSWAGVKHRRPMAFVHRLRGSLWLGLVDAFHSCGCAVRVSIKRLAFIQEKTSEAPLPFILGSWFMPGSCLVHAWLRDRARALCLVIVHGWLPRLSSVILPLTLTLTLNLRPTWQPDVCLCLGLPFLGLP